MDNIIEIKNIGKKYNINRPQGGYVALRDVLTNIFRNPFGYTKVKTKQVMGIGKKEDFWALKNINFNIKKGEIVGIIGSNGAGKSTLLKILSQITPPSTGEITIDGRVGSLLEVGTGFHPELTGRENIILNGAILGMTKKEVVKKFDEIVEFAGINKFIDTPVKYYSSGMYVRLAFSVAAHMEPEILIVDEVLAVGDSEFQKKCLGKMDEITKKFGRTILFVSHNMSAIEKLCSRCILLKDGQVIKDGSAKMVVDYYLNKEVNLSSEVVFPKKNRPYGQFTKLSIFDKNNLPSAQIPVSENFFIDIEYEIFQPVKKKMIFIHFYSQGDLFYISSEGDRDGKYRDYDIGKYRTRISIPAYLFQVGIQYFNVIFNHKMDGGGSVDAVQNLNFEITDKDCPRSLIFDGNYSGKISAILDYSTKKINY
jgi:lipopolysaccharide transport system ATP-binding protein